MNAIINGLKWAFGKDGSTVTQYILIIMLFSYKEDLITVGMPEAVIYGVVGVILNLNNNALKNIINVLNTKFQKSDTINQLVKYGMSFAAAIAAVDDPTVKTEFEAKKEVDELKQKLIELNAQKNLE